MEPSLHARDWEEMASLDPCWAILSAPDKRFGKWNIDEFLRSGEDEITALMSVAKELGVPQKFNVAIDFGCGVGRLTRALRARFEKCHGVDISSRMLEIAARLSSNCDFQQAQDLRDFPDRYADLVYSNLVLQHQSSRTEAIKLIRDMVRVLAPGGLLAFQVPIHMPLRNRIQPRRRAYRILRAFGFSESALYTKLKLTPIRMLWLPEAETGRIVREAGGTVIRVDRFRKDAEPFISAMFYCSV